jgi:(p)ppGpp synthase/HD superfamily hydrolase
MNDAPYILDYIESCKIAEKAHAKQKRFNGEPYINHCFRVANSVGDCYLRKSVAMLHDVIEDTNITSSDLLEAGLDQIIVDAVKALTKPNGVWYMSYVVDQVSKNPIAIDVKIADLCDNLNINQLTVVDERAYNRVHKYCEALKYLTTVKRDKK